jgi:hypothetical protein
MLKGNTTVTMITIITPDQVQCIKDFLQGAVYAWCNAKGNKWFFFKDLMGGNNYYWTNTPLAVLYEHYIKMGNDDPCAVAKAGQDAGMLLKSVLKDDKNKTFDQKKETVNNIPINKYQLV